MGNCLHTDTPCQLLCPVINIAMSNNFEYSHVHFTHFFSVTKLDLVIQYASTVTRLNSCSGEKYNYVSRAFCFYIEINIFEHF